MKRGVIMVGRGSKVVSLKLWRLKRKYRGVINFFQFIKNLFIRKDRSNKGQDINFKKPVNN